MRKRTMPALSALTALIAWVVVAAPGVSGAETKPGGHEGHSMEMSSGDEKPGVMIRHSNVDGYRFLYRILNWEERNKLMKGMTGPGMDTTGKATNDLMLYITGPDGKEVVDAKVGYLVIAPDNSEQKTLTMAMWGFFGADLILKAKGEYKIKTKVVVGGKTLTEDFTYTVK